MNSVCRPAGLNKILAFAITFIVLTAPNFSQVTGAGYSESYLLRNVGARAIAMAGAYTAIVNEPDGIFYNPAGLGFLDPKPMVSTSFSFLEFGRTHSSLAYGQTFGHFGLGLGFNNYTTGSFTARDVRGNSLGNFTDWQYALEGGASYSLEFASVGIGVKYLSNSLSGSGPSANGFAVDLGTKFNIMDLFSFGVAVQNISGIMFWNTAENKNNQLPFTLRSGIAMEFGLNDETVSQRSNVTGELESVKLPASRYILVGLDAIMTQFQNGATITLGVEVVPQEIIAFRGGIALLGDNLGQYELFPMTVWGGGISLRPQMDGLPFKIQIDYSIANDYLASNNLAHHLSLLFQF